MKKQTIWLTLLLDAGILLAVCFAPLLATGMIAWLPDCYVRQLGFLCPACGGTRCVEAFFGGDFSTAFRFNPAVFLLIIYGIVLLLLLNLQLLCKQLRPLTRGMVHPNAVIAAAILFVLFGIFRNF